MVRVRLGLGLGLGLELGLGLGLGIGLGLGLGLWGHQRACVVALVSAARPLEHKARARE